MAKRKTKKLIDQYKDMIVTDAQCFDAEGDPRLGILRIEAVGGFHELIITEDMANALIQELRDFLSLDSDRLP